MCEPIPFHHHYIKTQIDPYLDTLEATKSFSSSFPLQHISCHQRQQQSNMSDQPKAISTKLHESTPRSKQVVRVMTATTIGAALLGLSSLTLTGTVVALILSTPLLVIFSPVLVPAATLFFLIAVGFLFSGSCGVAAIAALTWLYNYVAGKHPPGADQLDYARMKIASTARDVKEKAKEYGNYGQAKSVGANQQVSS